MHPAQAALSSEPRHRGQASQAIRWRNLPTVLSLADCGAIGRVRYERRSLWMVRRTSAREKMIWRYGLRRALFLSKEPVLNGGFAPQVPRTQGFTAVPSRCSSADVATHSAAALFSKALGELSVARRSRLGEPASAGLPALTIWRCSVIPMRSLNRLQCREACTIWAFRSFAFRAKISRWKWPIFWLCA